MSDIILLKKELDKLANKKQARILQAFFKTGPGEYGEGDIFLGIKMPLLRKVVKKYQYLLINDINKLLHTKIHDYRMLAVLILVSKYKKGQEKDKNKIYEYYLKNTKWINNWDLVDLSAHYIVGDYLLNKSRMILYKLARSNSLWERRISIIATFAFIRNNDFKDSIKIAKILLSDEHDLIHKASGWMLREMGKRDERELIKFLDQHTPKMPRTMLRYAIERLPETKRQYYLKAR